MRTKFALIAAIASFLLVMALGSALAGADPTGPTGATGPILGTTTTAIPSPAAPQCANGIDDDEDGLVDMEDPDCESPADTSETPPATTPAPSEGESVPAPSSSTPSSGHNDGNSGGVEEGTSIGGGNGSGSKNGVHRNDGLSSPGSNDSGGVSAPSANGGGTQPLPKSSDGGAQFSAGGTPTTANPTTTIAPFGPAPIGVPNFVIDSFEIPPFLLPIYQACGTEYGIPWEVLASINKIETGFGTNLNVSSAGALGWMQFLPSSWEQFGLDANGDGKKDPYNPVDAICAAAHYLKLAGGDHDLYQAIFAYNHADWYVQEVLLYARAYGKLPSDLVGSLTGLTEGAHFPIAANARYADDLAARAALKRSATDSRTSGNAA
ncbi:MAG TPA: lytic transglycosylase domain-containing protein, partial [Solirubrobacterales bacterium]|nr:lytic transglycosylase domain-containing protein [Solirubrobacterales bacterium]